MILTVQCLTANRAVTLVRYLLGTISEDPLEVVGF